MAPLTAAARLRRALVHVSDDVLGDKFGQDLGRWMNANLALMERGGDAEGRARFNYEVTDVGNHYDGLAPFHKLLFEHYEDALEACQVEDFDPRYIETHLTLYHHGSHFVWHDDFPDYDGEFCPTRRLTFCYYLHTQPKMFQGGELEFLDGTLVTPDTDRLVFFHPLQQHRVRRVECYSAAAHHGRVALMGWMHGDPPDGYVENAPKMRGIPQDRDGS